MTIENLTFQVKETERRTTDMFTLVSLLCKNPRSVEMFSSFGNGNQDMPSFTGGTNYCSSSFSQNGTKEITETKD